MEVQMANYSPAWRAHAATAAQRSRGLPGQGLQGLDRQISSWPGPKAADETKQVGRDKEQQPHKKTNKKMKPPNPKGMGVRCCLAQARRARVGCPGGDVPFLPPAPLTEEKNKKNRKKA